MQGKSSSRSRPKSRFNIGRTSTKVGVAPTTATFNSDQEPSPKYTDVSRIYNNAIKMAAKPSSPSPTKYVQDRRPTRALANPGLTQRQQDERRMYGYAGRPQSANNSAALRPRSASAGASTANRPRQLSSGTTVPSSGGSAGGATYKRTLVYSDPRTQVFSAPEGQPNTNAQRLARPASASAGSRGGHGGSGGYANTIMMGEVTGPVKQRPTNGLISAPPAPTGPPPQYKGTGPESPTYAWRHYKGVRTGSRHPSGSAEEPQKVTDGVKNLRISKNSSNQTLATTPGRYVSPSGDERNDNSNAYSTRELRKSCSGPAKEQKSSQPPRPQSAHHQGPVTRQGPVRCSDDRGAPENAWASAGTASDMVPDEEIVVEEVERSRPIARPSSSVAMKKSKDLLEGGLVTGDAKSPRKNANLVGETPSSSSSLGGLLDNDEDSEEELAPRDGTIGKSKQLGGTSTDATGSKWAEGEGTNSRSASTGKRRPRSATYNIATDPVEGKAVQGLEGTADTGKMPQPGVRSGGTTRPKSAVARVQTQRPNNSSLDSSSSNGQRNQLIGGFSKNGSSARKVWANSNDVSNRSSSDNNMVSTYNESVETSGSNPQSAPARSNNVGDEGKKHTPPPLCPQSVSICDDKERGRLASVMGELVRKQGVSSVEFYDFGKVLGTGSFAKVREGFHKPTGSRVAVKTYDKAKIKDANQRRRIQQEIRLMEKLNHPRVIRHFEVLETSNRIHLVMECCGGGNLCSYLKRKRRLDEVVARTMLTQILDGLKYMHNLNVVHRDIKLENVLLDQDGSVKLVDFGFSAYVKDKSLKIFCGTPSYMAPEIIKRKEYQGKPVDVWSLGVVLYAMVVGRFPFSGKSYSELYRNVLTGQFKLPDQLSSGVRDLIGKMLVLDPATRWNLNQIETHPWLTLTALSPKHTPSASKVELVISPDPRDDFDESVIKKLVSFGVKKDVVVSCVLRKVHNCVTTTYYLLRSALYNQHLLTSQFAKEVVTVSA